MRKRGRFLFMRLGYDWHRWRKRLRCERDNTMPKAKKKMTAAEKAAARVPEPVLDPEPEVAPAPRERVSLSKEDKRGRRLLLVVGLVVLVLLGSVLYLSNYYHETDVARASLSSTEQVAVDNQGEWIAFGDPASEVGIVFYPGGKVAAEAYAPLARQMAENGVFCVVAKVTVNLAFLDVHAADDVLAAYPQVGTWYVGGHSLGGVAACQWAQEYQGAVAGIVLLGSYPSVDLSGSKLRMISIYGANDQVMNRDNYAESQALRPADFTETVVQGGNHAQFGEYGPQEGDGEPAISAQEQRDQTVDAILDWMKG